MALRAFSPLYQFAGMSELAKSTLQMNSILPTKNYYPLAKDVKM